jgi:2-succinyl-5-enolpyruvyl-6-hydroxy-3-cyclohexene-1-carboxylate synthase
VQDLVIAPGSRSAPLVYAAEAGRQRGDVRIWVRVDERSAGYVALGLALAHPRRPAAVITTSGTAAANLHPAVVEAAYAAVPLLALTADRPAGLQRVGANQTIEQRDLFGGATRLTLCLEAADDAPSFAAWHAAGLRAVRAACSEWGAHPGPVHVNLRFREPLAPPFGEPSSSVATSGALRAADGTSTDGQAPAGATQPRLAIRSGDRPNSPRALDRAPGTSTLIYGPRTVVLAGSGAGTTGNDLARDTGWPLLAEPASGSWIAPEAVPAYRRVVAGELGEQVQRVIVTGRPTLSREVSALVTRPGVQLIVVHPGGGPWFDPGRRAHRVATALDVDGHATAADIAWRDAWRAAGEAAWRAEWGGFPAPPAGRGASRATGASEAPKPPADCGASRATGASEALKPPADRDGLGAPAVERATPVEPAPPEASLTGPVVAAIVTASCTEHGAALAVAASNAIRYLDLAPAPRSPLRVFASRGAAGIDGTVSTAAGIAWGIGGPVRLLIGDLALMHDAGGLGVGTLERSPDLDVIVLKDRGGGIFRDLEHAAGPPGPFARYFLTPQRADLAHLAEAYGAAYVRADNGECLKRALASPPQGIRVIEVPLGPPPTAPHQAP